MTVYFMDSSAIAKHYVSEIGSTWVNSLVGPSAGHIIVLSQLAVVEVCAVLARKQRQSNISVADAVRRTADFLLDIDQVYLAIALDETILRQAAILISRYPLRSLDAIQLSCALQGRSILGTSLIFVTADNVLLSAASAEGLVTDNPLAHP